MTNETTKFKVVARTADQEIIPLAFPIRVNRLQAGDIVEVGEYYYRVYNGGHEARLRFWNVTDKYQQAVKSYNDTCWALAQLRELRLAVNGNGSTAVAAEFDEQLEELRAQDATYAQASGRWGL